MKAFLGALLFTAVLGGAFSQEAKGSLLELCQDDAACPSGTFCTGFMPFGRCKPATQIGGKCMMNKVEISSVFSLIKSPCAEGLVCQPKLDKFDQPKNDGICQLPPTPSPPPTTEGPSGDENKTDASQPPPAEESEEIPETPDVPQPPPAEKPEESSESQESSQDEQ